jgi:hypothetical protein
MSVVSLMPDQSIGLVQRYAGAGPPANAPASRADCFMIFGERASGRWCGLVSARSWR